MKSDLKVGDVVLWNPNWNKNTFFEWLSLHGYTHEPMVVTSIGGDKTYVKVRVVGQRGNLFHSGWGDNPGYGTWANGHFVKDNFMKAVVEALEKK